MAADEPVVRAQVSYFRDNHVPCDVFGFEPTWQTHSYSCTFGYTDSDTKSDPGPHRHADSSVTSHQLLDSYASADGR